MKSVMLAAALTMCTAIAAAPAAASTTTPAAVTGVLIDPASGASTATALNNRGEVVGVDNLHCFAWQDGVLTNLGVLPGSDYSRATALNERGDIVGYSGMYAADRETPVHAVLWQHGTMTDLETLGGDNSFARAINNRGVIVGGSQLPGNAQGRAVVWQHGTMTALPTLPGSYYDTAAAINERGDIAGDSMVSPRTEHAVVWTADGIVDLGPGQMIGLNERGQVLVDATPPFIWYRGGKTALPDNVTAVAAINDHGQVAGTYLPAGSATRHGFLWDDGRLTDLGTLSPVALNAHGQVLARSLTEFGLAYVWDHGQVTQLVSALGYVVIPVAINDHGLVAGASGFDTAAVWQLPHCR